MTRQPEEDTIALRSTGLLHRIASALDLPVAAFSGPLGERPSKQAQALALLTAFDMIEDPELRARCLAFVLEAAAGDPDRSDGDTSRVA
ncbi:hypothetical protein [Methylobacterium trifolii]|uniref:XRE family transcriptional regulator n=1 Tax=Methylobacterium trifolii TaxID=1003092 RepID=A0ABQ4TZM7_9HYPH|nr:hypothetical protein [Methylobacterium trifolii]GJE60704.1 hypothetical protein MPOCJGCO_2818 [Methylobacterium trifolii]